MQFLFNYLQSMTILFLFLFPRDFLQRMVVWGLLFNIIKIKVGTQIFESFLWYSQKNNWLILYLSYGLCSFITFIEFRIVICSTLFSQENREGKKIRPKMAPQLLKFHISSISRLLHSTPSLSFLSLSKTPKLSNTLSISFYVDLWSD